MEQKELLVIVNGNYQRIVNCRSFSVPTVRRKDCNEIYGMNTTNEMGVVILLYIISDWNILLLLFTFSSQGWDGFSNRPQSILKQLRWFYRYGLCGMRYVLTWLMHKNFYFSFLFSYIEKMRYYAYIIIGYTTHIWTLHSCSVRINSTT